MIELGVNIDHVATLRQARRGKVPDPVAAAVSVDDALARNLTEMTSLTSDARLEARYEKFRNMGRLGIDFTDG